MRARLPPSGAAAGGGRRSLLPALVLQACDWLSDQLEQPPPGAEGLVPGMPEEVAEYLAAIMVGGRC